MKSGTATETKVPIPKGYNPLRWDCEKSGCFNRKRRPKIELFADCFPGRINFGDVDGLVEIAGCFALLEWKGASGAVSTGQRISFERHTKQHEGNIVFVVEGDAETMEVRRYCCFYRGRQSKWRSGDLRVLKNTVRKWAEHCKASAPASAA